MKYGQHFEEESVPGWSLHNIDYNSLKHQIKTHTAKDQASAIAIPGHQDSALKKFEDAFYAELCRQHDRVDVFVVSKADEIFRRLSHLSSVCNKIVARCYDERGLTVKQQRRLAKYHQQALACGDDIKALARFVNAQVVAFRKILKKYRKWTKSTSLGSRFKDNILSSPKSFTKRDFHPLRLQYQHLCATLDDVTTRITTPDLVSPSASGSESFGPRSPLQTGPRSRSISFAGPLDLPAPQVRYWNEYDHGSDAGDDSYAIYIDPDASPEIPGFTYVKTMFAAPVDKVRHWLRPRGSTSLESESLLNPSSTRTDYASFHRPGTGHATDTEVTEDEYASSDEFAISAHRTWNSGAPDLEEQKHAPQYDQVLSRCVIIAYVIAFVLLVLTGVLIATGSQQLRLEIDAFVTLGSVASLFCGCMGLGAMFACEVPKRWAYTVTVWAAFATICVLNAMLLILVVGSSGL